MVPLLNLIIFVGPLMATVTTVASEYVEVSCGLGSIMGTTMQTKEGKNIFAFRNIKYAEAPVGELRFRPPVPVQGWNGNYDATAVGPKCPQAIEAGWTDDMDEDCLRLNIYTKELPQGGSSVSRPVMVFFHPGFFSFYSGQSTMWGPEYLLDEDIVLVTVNYRLGALGWISTGDEYAPGNLGLKDQVAALRFVQQHIAAFGGDPNSVTISGYSAGGWSVSVHLISPMSKGLFHRAIAMSGSSIYHIPLQPGIKRYAAKQAEFVGCPTESSEEIISCLRTKDVKEIIGSSKKFLEWREAPNLIWQPVVEPQVSGEETFIPAQPAQMIKDGQFYKVPMMIGTTQEEFGAAIIKPVVLAKAKNDYSYIEEINNDWTRIAPIWFGWERGSDRSLNISNDLRQFYFGNEAITLDNIDGIRKMHADLIHFMSQRLAKIVSTYSDQPVYFYLFTFQGRFSFFNWPADDKNPARPFGVCHHDDLIYLFTIKDMKFPLFKDDDPETPTVKKMTAMWANFVINGQPIPNDRQEFSDVTWTPFTEQNKAYLQIDKSLEMREGYFEDRMNEWEKVFPIEQHFRKSDSQY